MNSFQKIGYKLRHLSKRELWLLLYLPIHLIWYLILEQVYSGNDYYVMHSPLDDMIPFCEWFVLFYCAWYPLLVTVGIYLLLRDAPAFRRYMAFLAVTFFASVLIWLLIPNGQDLRPQVFPRENLPTTLVAALYRIDTNTNVFPSVHVVGSVGAALAVWDSPRLRAHPLLRWGVPVLAALICISTLFIKQHSVLDVVSGLVLSLLAAIPIYLIPWIRAKKLP